MKPGQGMAHRSARTAVALCIAAAGLAAMALNLPASSEPAEAGHPSSREPVGRVVLISIPGLGFDDLSSRATPNFTRLADRGATAALSVKTVGRRTDRAAAYATIGAGARAVAPNTAVTSGRSVYERLTSGRTMWEWVTSGAQNDRISPEPAVAVVVPDLDAVVDANSGQHQGAVIGALGKALTRQGWTTAVVSNHDGVRELDRVAALALVRRVGRERFGSIDFGSVHPSLTTVAPDGRRRSNGNALATEIGRLAGQRAVVVVEIGDVAWGDASSGGKAKRRAAVASADDALGRVAAALGPEDLVIVLSPTAPAGQEQPTPFVMMGPGVATGYATSATTRRSGNVTLPDVSATILDRIGAPKPPSMAGTPITVDGPRNSGAERLAHLRIEIGELRFVDRSAGIFLVTLPIVFACWALATLLAAIVPLGSASRGARGFVRWFGLGIAIVPITAFLVGGFQVGTWGQPRWSAVVWSLAAVAGLVAWCLRPPARGVVAIVTTIWIVLVGDLLTGGALQFGTPLGNSPTVAGRFSGIGNIAFALLAASTLILSVAVWHQVKKRRPGGLALTAAGAVFAVAIVVDGAPSLGSDVGGVLTLVPVAALTLWSLSGRALSWRRVAGAGVGTLVVVGLLVMADFSRPESSRTHLGRLTRDLIDGRGSGDVFRRKLDASLASYVDSSLVWIVISTFLLAGLLWALDRDLLRGAMRRPYARTLLTGAVALGVLGAALNDSGVMVPAMMATVFVPAAIHLLLAAPVVPLEVGNRAGAPRKQGDNP